MTIWEVIQLISTKLLEERHLGPIGSYILAHDWPSKSREYGFETEVGEFHEITHCQET